MKTKDEHINKIGDFLCSATNIVSMYLGDEILSKLVGEDLRFMNHIGNSGV